jgi:hypothetical protein
MVMALCNAQGIGTISGPDGVVTCVFSGPSTIDPGVDMSELRDLDRCSGISSPDDTADSCYMQT